MTIHNTEGRPYVFFPPEDRNKCDRMWTTDIEILAQKVEELAFQEMVWERNLKEFGFSDNGATLQAKMVAKLKADVAYLNAKLDYYAAYMAAGSRLGFRDDPTIRPFN